MGLRRRITIGIGLIILGVLLLVLAAVLPAFAAGPEDFLGTWEGSYPQGKLDTALVVEKLVDGEAVAIYKWGKSPIWNIWEAGEQRVFGKFLDDKRFRIQVGYATVTYTMNGDGTLTAEYSTRRGNSYATLKKKP